MGPETAGGPLHDIVNELIAEFQGLHPNVTIIHEALPTADLRTKLTVEFAADNPPDVSWAPLSFAREFMRGDMIIDWRPVYEDPRHRDFFNRYFSQALLNFADYGDGRLMMAPREASIDALFYNRELFAQHGWQPPKTFDDLLNIAREAREVGIHAMVTGGRDLRFAWMASALLARTGGLENAYALTRGDAMTEWNNPNYGFPQAMQKFKEMVDAEVFPPGTLGLSTSEADQLFVDGKVAMYYEGQWKPGGFENIGGREFIDKLGRVPFPAMPDMPMGDPDVNVGGSIVGFIVANNLGEAKTQASIEWVKLMTGPDFWIPAIESGGGLPAGNFDYDVTKVPRILNELHETFLNTTKFLPSMDTLAAPVIDMAIKQTAMPGILSGALTVEQAIEVVQDAAEEFARTVQ